MKEVPLYGTLVLELRLVQSSFVLGLIWIFFNYIVSNFGKQEWWGTALLGVRLCISSIWQTMVSAVWNVGYKTILKLTYRAAKNMKHISRLSIPSSSAEIQVECKFLTHNNKIAHKLDILYNWSAFDLIHIIFWQIILQAWNWWEHSQNLLMCLNTLMCLKTCV